MTDIHTTDKFFTAGGTLPLDAVYVSRQADEQLLHATLQREYCNILTPRQIGKSSLMVHTAERLQEEGVRTAIIDLNEIGTELNAEEWYFGLVTRLKENLELAVDERIWWNEHSQQGIVQRFSDFLRYVILEEISESVVVFVDEIDSTLSLTFTDDFFAAIRAAYNARASDPAYKRLTFILLGVVRPADLIKDRARTPYNIGLSIDLTDFTLEETKTLLPGLEAISTEQAEMMLERVLYWTGGHPYLTQKVCEEIVKADDNRWTDEKIDRLVKRLFQSDEARKESNLQFVRDRIWESSDREKLLRTYRQAFSGKEVADEEHDPSKSQLKLIGLLRVTSHGKLTVRNRIYRLVFDDQWIRDTMPKVTSTRIIIVSVVITLIALAIGAFLLYRQQNEAEILARTYLDAFVENQSAPVRIANLAGLFRLGGEYADSAREIFFALDADQQLAIFTGLTTPEEVGEDLQTVIKGLYSHLENTDEHNVLLQSMTQSVAGLREAFPDSFVLSGQLDAWLEGRTLDRMGDYKGAIRLYDRAIKYPGQNPTIYLDRAIAHTQMGQYGKALADLNQVVDLDSDRGVQVLELIQSNSLLYRYLDTHQEEFPTLMTLLE